MRTSMKDLVVFVLCLLQWDLVTGHGRMIEPAARNVMWRYDYKNPRNYNDMGLNCGGFTVIYSQSNQILNMDVCYKEMVDNTYVLQALTNIRESKSLAQINGAI